MDTEIKSSLTATDTWLRGLYMLLFAVIYSLVELVLGLIVVFQFIHVLFTRDTNERLLDFGNTLSVFIYQVLQFITFNSEAKPFPFAPWPEGPEDLESLDVMDNVEVSDSDDDATPEAEAASEAAPEPAAEEAKPAAAKPAASKSKAKAAAKDENPPSES